MNLNLSELLNRTQYLAATTLDAPLCILAGAGTGKTRVITHRIAHLIERGAWPESIMGLTFTNKAASEMRERVEHLVPGLAHRVWLGTFHGLSARLLRRFGAYVGVNPSFLIYDQDDAHRLLRKIAVEQLNLSRDYLAFYVDQVEKWQNEGLWPSQVELSIDGRMNRAKELYELYWHQMSAIGAIDFNGLLLKWRELLKHEEAGAQLRAQFKHILVDEYQDTNPIQAEIVLLLGKEASSIAIVGDDDQSIYSWRGAKPHNMQEFLDHMPNAKLIKLEHNYRSTSTILQAANGVISRNASRIGKNLEAVNGEGELVRLIRMFTDRHEADLIVRMIETETFRGYSLSDFAILMRTNAQSRPFEESLRRAKLPYRLVGGTKFYDRKEVKDVLSTLKAAINPRSDVDLLRSITAVPRGIGDTSLKKAQEEAQKRNVSLMEVLLSKEALEHSGVGSKAVVKMLEFANRLQEFGLRVAGGKTQTAATQPIQGDLWAEAGAPVTSTLHKEEPALNAEQAISLAIEVSGVGERLNADKSDEAQDRLENLGQLVSAAQQYVEEALLNRQPADALGFLEATALLSTTEDLNRDTTYEGAVTLMTLHAAKGLEFDTVFMVGMEEYGFPHSRALEEGADKSQLEEERRLAYVGMTRARKRLYLTYAQRRMIRGTVKPRVPTRFLRELPRHVVSGDTNFHTEEVSVAPLEDFEPPVSRGTRVELDPEYAPTGDGVALRTGARVWHATFGSGRVIDARGSGHLARATVRFDHDGKQRAIIAKYLRAQGG